MLGNFSYYNPTLEKLNEGVKIARENNVDLILALGGGSVCDYSKAAAASVYPAGYLDLTKEDITEILKESM